MFRGVNNDICPCRMPHLHAISHAYINNIVCKCYEIKYFFVILQGIFSNVHNSVDFIEIPRWHIRQAKLSN